MMIITQYLFSWVGCRYSTLQIYKMHHMANFHRPRGKLRPPSYPCVMIDSLLVIFSALFIIGSAHALVSAPNCPDSNFAWSFNSLGQSPCLVAAYLAAVCNSGSFVISALLPQNSYTGPSGSDDGDICKCNTVVYNLISACDACQGEPWIPYSSWSLNCTSVAIAGTFPDPIPAGTRVPKWAFLDPTPSDDWNLTAASRSGDSPEVTGSAPIFPTSVRGSQSTITLTTNSPESSSAPQSSSSKTGAIAGGVVGGVVGAALIAGVVIWFTTRRRRGRLAPSAAFAIDLGSDIKHPVPYPLSMDSPRLYDPSDPSTFPIQAPSPTIWTTNQSTQHPGSVSDFQSQPRTYGGLPEV
ncbi:hypothetical protein BC826DRAFT_1097725 [Russula brevipes]|nr:hypothetical protein BC826DRAFT_1097725 [Russula brevipes]